MHACSGGVQSTPAFEQMAMHRFPTSDMETEANKFASALLMPEADIRPALRGRRVTLQLLAALKPEWKVAMQALLVRATDLHFVTANQARYLWQQISAHGWRLREPPELDFAPEIPAVLTLIVKSYLSDLGYSMDQLTNMMRIHESEFVEMYGKIVTPTDPKTQRLRIVS
jgi:Zn-dependent peptidase ImmA (M78 family)